MNEVRPTPVLQISPVVTSAASSTHLDEASILPLSGEALPVEKDKPIADVAASNIEQPSNTEQSSNFDQAPNIEQVVTEINEYVQTVQRDLHFSIDEDSGLTVVRVRDKESGELIRQIPEDIFLNMAQNLKENQSIHLFDAHG